MSVQFPSKEKYDIDDLLRIMEILRGEGGCPWDKEQNHHSIRNNFIEETYEVIEAIDINDTALLKEELGDVLLQIVFHAQMEKEQNQFGFDDVCNDICKKLIHRHPHVFGDVVADNAEQVLTNWDNIKRVEKKQATSTETLKSVSNALPSLMRSYKVQKRAAKSGFDYHDYIEALADLNSEISELQEAIAREDNENIEEELGDLLFSVVNVSRLLKKDPEELLYKATDKFIARFEKVEQRALQQGKSLSQCSFDELNDFWGKAKK